MNDNRSKCRMNCSRGYDIDKNQRIWKYLEFPKLLRLINYNRLPLRRLDKFEDKFEGKMPLKILEQLPIERREEARMLYEVRRKQRYVDCWTRFDGKESYAMWKIYSNRYGIAIETDTDTLASLLPENAIISKVKYYDFRDNNSYIKDLPELWDSSLGEEYSELAKNFSAVKSIEYEYEKEIRAILPRKSEEEYVFIDMDMKRLIKKIIISPYEQPWFSELLMNILYDKFHMRSVEVIKSDIDIQY